MTPNEVRDEFDAIELWQDLGYEDENEFAADVLADLAESRRPPWLWDT